MVRSPCCSDVNLKKGPWTPEEDEKLIECVNRNGHSNWKQVPKLAGLNRCGKSCRLRWTNYLRPDIKRGRFTEEEERVIINLHSVIGNKWSRIAAHLPGRTDNEIKNFWNTHIRRKLLQMGIDPNTHKPRTDFNYLLNLSQLLAATRSSPWNNLLMLQADATKLAKLQLLQNLLQIMNTSTLQNLENSSLLGSLNIDPAEGLLNGTIAGNLYSEEPTPEVVGFLNCSEAPQLCSDLQAAENSWTCYAGGLDTGSLNTKNSSLSSSYECNIQAESNPPKLVSASASPEASIVNETESNANPSNYSTSSPASTIFEAWDKILEDEASGSCWKDILDLIASS